VETGDDSSESCEFQTNSREVEAFIAPSTSPITESFRRTLVRLKQLARLRERCDLRVSDELS